MFSLSEHREAAQYQDIVVRGETIHHGRRECESRWDLIEPHLPEGVIVDFGSNAGYFSTRAAENPHRMVWSIEANESFASLQRDIHAENAEPNVVLTGGMSLLSWLDVERSVNRIDAIIALSVLEYFPPDELMELLRVFARITPRLFAEVCDPSEPGVGGDATTIAEMCGDFGEYLRLFFPRVDALGVTPSAVDPSKNRTLWLASNDAPMFRNDLTGWIGGERGRRHTLAHHRGHWVMDGRTTVDAGLNLWNMLRLGLAYPLSDGLAHAVSEIQWAYANRYSMDVTDLHPRNVILTADGPVVIDGLERFANPLREGAPRAEFDFPSDVLRQIVETKTAIETGSLLEYRIGWERWK